MARVTQKANNFSSGEISPRLVGMTDQDRYQTAALKLENMIPLLQGGAVRRPGFVHAGYAGAPSGPVRLVPYAASRADAALLVLTPGRMRIFTAAGPVGTSGGSQLLELPIPWTTAAQLQQLDWAQDGDALYLAQGDFAPQRVRHVGGVGSLLWTIGPVPFVVTPRDEVGHRFPTVFLSLASGFDTPGASIWASASGAVFLPSDVGRYVEGAGGRAAVTAVDPSNSAATVRVVEPFAMGVIPTWSLSDSPRALIHFTGGTGVAGAQPVGTSLTLNLKDPANAAIAGWRPQDAGSWVSINGGLVEILPLPANATFDPTSVKSVVRKTVPSPIDAPADSWQLLQPVWSDASGWPRTVTLMEQRLVFGGNAIRPLDVWGSAIGFPLDFAPGVLDDDAWDFKLAAEQAQSLRYVCGGRVLAGFCAGTEFSLSGGNGAITPTNVQLRSQTGYGSAQVRPVKVGTEVLFVSGGSRKLRAFAYRLDADAYAAPDMSVFSDHITAPALVDMAWQQEPDALLWLVRADGVLLSVTYDRDQGVVAWARHPTMDPLPPPPGPTQAPVPGPAVVLAVGVLPLGDGLPDRLYAAVVRQGVLRVEYLEPLDLPGQDRPGAMRADAGVQATAAAPQAKWPGLVPHLAVGTPVDVVADGVDLGSLPVLDGGELDLPVAASRVQAGVGFTATLVPTVPELAGPGASAALAATRRSRVLLQYLAGIGGRVNGQDLPGRAADPPVLDAAPQPATWSGELFRLGWERGPQPTVVTQDRPVPFYVLGVITRVEVNDG